MPVALSVNNTRATTPAIMITNSGSQRFDIYAGTFTKNDQLTASPFADSFLYIPEVPLSVAIQVLPALNDAGADERRRDLLHSELDEREMEYYARGYVDKRYREWLADMHKRHGGAERRAATNLTLGYVTTDACPGVGDDTPHIPLAFYDTPDFIGSDAPDVPDDTPIDLVFVDFIESQLLGILNGLQTEKVYTEDDVSLYTPVLASEVLGIYAQAAWN